MRTLVVIDLEDPEMLERLSEAYASVDYGDLNDYPLSVPALHMQAALRSLLAPTKPPEPQGIGAVLEDRNGDLWVRTEVNDPEAPPWFFNAREADAGCCWYVDIDVALVLSEGVR